ncbi:hypothetical protein WA171_007350, partial [Blastocystis sp. BT1]
MNERTAERRQAKEMVLKMMRANGMYDELRSTIRASIEKTLNNNLTQRDDRNSHSLVTQYYSLHNNEIATGFIVDFLRSLQLTSTLSSLESCLSEASYYERTALVELFQIEDIPGQPLILQLFHSVDDAEPQGESFLKMQSTVNIHNTCDDAFGEENSVDILSHIQ